MGTLLDLVFKITKWISVRGAIFFIIISIGFCETIETIIVRGNNQEPTSVGSQNVTQKKIELMLEGNGDIGSVLKLNPNLKIENKNNNKNDITDIKPSKIKINGARFYQNTFLLDGASNDSLLDPVNSSEYSINDVAGNENAMFIDLDLIQSIDVFDSAVSAKYGNFSGGVINVITKRPTFETKTKAKVKHTNDSFINFHSAKYDDGPKYGQDMFKPRRFQKTFASLLHNHPINEYSAILGTYSYKESSTPKSHFDGFKDTSQKSHNLLLKYSYFFDDDSIVDITSTYSSFQSNLFRTNVKDSDFENETGGFSLQANYEKDYDFGNTKTIFRFGQMKNARKNSPKDYFGWLRLSSKSWGVENMKGKSYSYKGGFGNINKQNDLINFDLQFDSNKHLLFDTQNKISSGFGLQYAKANHNRDENSYRYYNPKHNNNVICNGASACVKNEQYFQNRRAYVAEDVSVDISSFNFFLEDSMQYKQLKFKPGIRFDYNTFLKNIDIAPRINSSLDVFGDDKTVFFGGVNRYYGKSFLAFKLREARTPYQTEYRATYLNQLNQILPPNNNPTIWNVSANKGENKYVYHNLKTSYSDEILMGLRQTFFNNILQIKYILRDYKDQFKEFKGDYKLYTRKDGQKAYYRPIFTTNDGQSEYDSVSFQLKNKEDINVFGGNFYYDFSTSINLKNETNFNSYDYESEIVFDGYVLYNGKLIDRNALPKEEEPTKSRLFLAISDLNYDIFGYKAKTSFSATANYTFEHKIIQLQEGLKNATVLLPDNTPHDIDVSSYEDKKYKGYATFDTKINMFFPIFKNSIFAVSIEILNLFDYKSKEEMDSRKYSMGRQLWLEASYSF